MKKLIWKIGAITALFILIGSCKNDPKESDKAGKESTNGFTLTGTVKNVDKGVLYINYNREDGWGKDTITITNGHFTHQGTLEYPHLAYLQFSGKQGYPSPFFLENKTVSIQVDTSETDMFSITGSPLHEEYLAYLKLTEGPYREKLIELYNLFESTDDQAETTNIQLKIDSILQKITVAANDYIEKNPSSFVTANAILDQHGYNPNPNELDKIYTRLDAKIKESGVGKKIKDLISIAKRTSVGQPATDLTVNDANGNPISLLELKGKYVFLDFWASWCGPCRAENPTVKKAYQKYKDQGFEIYAVSLDVIKEDWINAIEEDGLPWLHVSDLKKNNEAAAIYGVEGIPMNYLIDPEGIIVAKDLRGEDLMEKLEEVF